MSDKQALSKVLHDLMHPNRSQEQEERYQCHLQFEAKASVIIQMLGNDGWEITKKAPRP